MKNEDKSFSFKVPIYNCDVTVVISDDFLKAGRNLGDELELNINDHCGIAYKNKKDCLKYIILIKHKYEHAWDIIAHEALHVVNFILSDRGIKASLNNDEGQAYLLSFIIKNIQKLKK